MFDAQQCLKPQFVYIFFEVRHPRCVGSITKKNLCITHTVECNYISLSSTLGIQLHHKVHHHCCVYNKLDWSLYTCLTQLCGGIDLYNLLHEEQLHVSALFICHLQVDKP